MSREFSFAASMVEEDPSLREGEMMQTLKRRLEGKKVEIDGQELWVVEGDILMDEDQLAVYADRLQTQREIERLSRERPGMRSGGFVDSGVAGLVANTQGDRIVRWRPGLELSYCVLRDTFLSDDQYETVRDNMELATNAWAAVCGVTWDYRPELDDNGSTTPEEVLFSVRFLNVGGRFIAAAFFPDDPRDRRRVVIDPSYFTTSFDPVGVLRHELGHVLGFRHEHIRSGAPAVCPDESTVETVDLTDYDPQSCMHYFCGGVGSRELAISPLDRDGAQRVYGLPLARFVDVG